MGADTIIINIKFVFFFHINNIVNICTINRFQHKTFSSSKNVTTPLDNSFYFLINL